MKEKKFKAMVIGAVFGAVYIGVCAVIPDLIKLTPIVSTVLAVIMIYLCSQALPDIMERWKNGDD